jgi:hypothetical protein
MRSLTEERDKIEVLLAFGATRTEACLPVAREALRLALLPAIQQLSVIGLISIPGMACAPPASGGLSDLIEERVPSWAAKASSRPYGCRWCVVLVL